MGYRMKGFSGFKKSPVKKLDKAKMEKGLADLNAGMNEGIGAFAKKGGQSPKEAQDEAQQFDPKKGGNKLDAKPKAQNEHTACPAYGGGVTKGKYSGMSQAQIREDKTRGRFANRKSMV